MKPFPVCPVLNTASPADHAFAPLPSRSRVTVYVYGPLPLGADVIAMNSTRPFASRYTRSPFAKSLCLTTMLVAPALMSAVSVVVGPTRSEEHTSELHSPLHLVFPLLF